MKDRFQISIDNIVHCSNVVFMQHLDTTCTEDTLLSSCDIKSLYTNICHDVFYKAIDYWIEKLINEIPLLRRFTKAFILEGLSIILEFNYFHINNYFSTKSKELLWELFLLLLEVI